MPGADVAVLLEGVSDVAAVRAMALSRGIDPDGVRLVDMGGVTNVHRELTRLRQRSPQTLLLGLCDAGEVRFVERALRAADMPVRDAGDLPSYGFFVCQRDLEDELIRALGTDAVVQVIGQLGLADKLAGLQQQPAWRDQPLSEQLHRFCGVASGRKEQLAGALATALGTAEVPEPLHLLLQRIQHAPHR